MQTIGKMEDGRVLVVLSVPEYNVLTVIETNLITPPAAGPGVHEANGDMLPAHAKAPSPSRNLCRKSRVSSPPRVVTEVGKPARNAAHSAAGGPICRTCGKPITRKKG